MYTPAPWSAQLAVIWLLIKVKFTCGARSMKTPPPHPWPPHPDAVGSPRLGAPLVITTPSNTTPVAMVAPVDVIITCERDPTYLTRIFGVCDFTIVGSKSSRTARLAHVCPWQPDSREVPAFCTSFPFRIACPGFCARIVIALLMVKLWYPEAEPQSASQLVS